MTHWVQQLDYIGGDDLRKEQGINLLNQPFIGQRCSKRCNERDHNLGEQAVLVHNTPQYSQWETTYRSVHPAEQSNFEIKRPLFAPF